MSMNKPNADPIHFMEVLRILKCVWSGMYTERIPNSKFLEAVILLYKFTILLKLPYTDNDHIFYIFFLKLIKNYI